MHQLSELVYEKEIGWIGQANFAGRSKHGDYPNLIPVSINSDGFRDEDWDAKLWRAQILQSKKILLIGDSWLYGWGSEIPDRLSEALAHRYSEAEIQVEVFNAGIPAYGVSQERRLLPRLLERINPHLVVVLFCSNDYGDTALPYDHRNPAVRVYKPFYNAKGELVANEVVPKRPSLVFKGSVLGKLYLWYALDVFYYQLQNLLYKSKGIPQPADFPLPVHRLDDLVFQDRNNATYRQVERTVMALYRDMDKITKKHGATFVIVSSHPSTDDILEPNLKALGIDFIRYPKEYEDYLFWTYIYKDGHPNFLATWILSGSIFSHLERVEASYNLADMPAYGSIPSELKLNSDKMSAKYIFGTWGLPEKKGRWALSGGDSWTGQTPRFLLRTPSLAGKAKLRVFVWSPYKESLVISDHKGKRRCTWNLVPDKYQYECDIDSDHKPLLLGEISVENRSVTDSELLRYGTYHKLAFFTSISLQ